MVKVIYFTAGAIATAPELAEIAKLNAATVPALEVVVRRGDGVGTQLYGAGEEAADYVAGTPPAPYDDTEDYPVADPDNPPVGAILGPLQAVVTDGQEITVTGGTATITVVDGEITEIVIA